MTHFLDVAVTGGLNATPESFFPTLPSLSLLVEDAAEGFSSLFARTSPDMPGAGDLEDSKSGVPSTSPHDAPCLTHPPPCGEALYSPILSCEMQDLRTSHRRVPSP